MTNYNSPTLEINVDRTSEGFLLRMYSPILNTVSIPQISLVLSANLPSIMNAECFNPANLPFSEEVKNTELGHLFEHILLEYLCEEKMKQGNIEICFEGHTDWDWQTHPKGSYNIYIGYSDKVPDCFEAALEKTIDLFNKIIDNDATGSLQAARSNHYN